MLIAIYDEYCEFLNKISPKISEGGRQEGKFKRFLGILMARTYRTYCAIGELYSNKFFMDSLVLARTLVELRILGYWVANKNSEIRAKKYFAQSIVKPYETIQKIKKLPNHSEFFLLDNEKEKRLEEQFHQVKKTFNNKPGLPNLLQMARELDLYAKEKGDRTKWEYYYRMTYGSLSSGGHFDSWGIKMFFIEENSDTMILDRKEMTGTSALKTSLDSTNRILDLWNSAFEEIDSKSIFAWQTRINEAIQNN